MANRRPLAFAAASLAAIAMSCFVASHLRWNLTDSLPRGLYMRHVSAVPPARGDLVAFDVPAHVRDLVWARGYLHPGVQLFKEVVALPGDRVCLSDGRYMVNGDDFGPVLDSDRSGAPLPHPTFCGDVAPGSAFVATRAPNSFDSRYFGPLPFELLADRLHPLWTF